jgi:CheY-like chemotaxis protein
MTGDKKMKTVLVVDDDRVMTTVLSVWLKRMGHAVMVEHDVPDAIKVMKARLVDAIILDLDMPSGRGTEVIERLKTFHRTGSIPIIVLSANQDPGVMASVLAGGADKFIVKPTSSENVAETLQVLFERQEKVEKAREAQKVAVVRDRRPEPVVRYKGSQVSLEALVNMDIFQRFLRKTAN